MVTKREQELLYLCQKNRFSVKITVTRSDYKVVNQQEDIQIVNIYALTIRAPKYIKQVRTEWKEEKYSNKSKTF